MRLAYIHDHKYYRYNGRIYSAGTMSSSVFSRFWLVADEITIFAYIVDLTEFKNVGSMVEIDDCRISFIPLNSGGAGPTVLERIYPKKNVLAQIRKYDGVVARIPGTLTCMYCDVLLREKVVPLGLEVVGCTFDALWGYGGFKAKLAAVPSYLIMRSVVKRCLGVVYVTESFLQSRYPTSGKTINASNVVIHEVKDENCVAVKAEGGDTRPRLGIVGNWSVRYKGHDVLFEALSGISNKKYCLDLVGTGDKQAITAVIDSNGLSESVRVVGKLRPGKDMIDWLDSIDLLVHPSKQEGLPRIVIEAMSRGCPVLASSIAGIPELLPRTRLHKPGDSNALRAQLLDFFNDPESFRVDAVVNIERSKDYLYPVIENRRLAFWREFFSEERCY